MRLRVRACLTLGVAFLGGCASFLSVPPEAIVTQRAQERLDALMSGQTEESYAYTTPGYRSIRTWQEYSRNWAGVGMWLSAEVTEVDCGDLAKPQRCDAVVFVEFKAPRLQQSETYLRESWLLIDRNWYFYQKP